MHNDREVDEPVTRREFDQLVYRVDGLTNLVTRLYEALGTIVGGEGIKAKDSE